MPDALTQAATPVRPLTDSDFGAEVLDVDLGQSLAPAAIAGLRVAFDRHRLLLFRRQKLTREAHIAFSRHFGELEHHVLSQYLDPKYPELYVISNVGPDGQPKGEHPDKGTLWWHTDTSFTRTPSLATILRGIELPADGGETWFADMQGAYDALPDATKARIAGLRVVHDLATSRERSGDLPATDEQRRRAPPVDHPLVRTHPVTGRKGLYMGLHADHIVGMDREAGRALLDDLQAFATQDRFVYKHRWSPDELVMWDNRATLHRATSYDTGRARRVVERTVVRGEVPV
jgi:taurine dioxygenase